MKKQILSLLLVVSLLLSAVPAVAAAETPAEPAWSCSLTLQDSIAINFKVAEADLAEFEQIAFYKGETLVKTVTEMPAAENGKVSFSFANLTPGELGTKVTAKLTLGGVVYEKSLSVLDYCKAILSGYYHTSLKKVAADLLNFGAASQDYIGSSETNVNKGMTSYENALATQDGDLSLENILAQGEALEGAAATWAAVGLNLKDSVTIRFKFAAESTEGLTLKVACDGKSWEVSKFQSAGEGLYYAFFSELNPAQMRDTVTAVLCDAEGTPVSRTLTYSIASYAAYVVNEDTTGAYAEELELVKEMIRYGDAVSAWLEGGAATVPANAVIADGEYVITAVDKNGVELATLGNVKGSSSDIAMDSDATWNIRVLDETGAAYLTTVDSEGATRYPVRANGGSNMEVGKTATAWTITKSGEYYTLKNTNTDTRYLACYGTTESDVFTPSGFKSYAKGTDVRFIQFKLTPVAQQEPEQPEEPAEPGHIIQDGNYMIVAVAGDKYYAMGTTSKSGVVAATEVTVEDGTVTTANAPYWYIDVQDADGTAVLRNADSKYVMRTENKSNLTVGSEETKWIIAKDETTGNYTLTNVNGDTRYLAYNGSGFKAYTNPSATQYYQFLLIPVAE